MYVGDFHIHSHYARATSKDMNLEELDRWAKIKGISVIGTGDFTHPDWFEELRQKLEPAEEPGLFVLRESRIKNQESRTRFLLTVEVSSIYSKGGQVRKIHNIIFAPSFEAASEINTKLSWVGNLRSDGRPILGLDAKELAKIVFGADENCLLIPAHVWTPWFSIFGSKSGFDSIAECFEEYAPQILAIETGLSSDPPMNWRVSALDNVALISNSDSHSAPKIGREANMFEGEVSYSAITEAIKYAAPKRASERALRHGSGQAGQRAMLVSTIEFFPEEGKYHYDGHRLCNVSMNPSERKEQKGLCTRCGRPVTVGVMSRVDELADRKEGERPEGAPDFISLVQLEEIIADALGQGRGTKGVREIYDKLIQLLGNEFHILLEASIEEIGQASTPLIGEGVSRVRDRKLHIEPGYDGEFGKVEIFTKDEREQRGSEGARVQKSLFS